MGQIVVIRTPDGSIEGEVVSVNDDTVVVQRYDGRNVTINRSTVQSLRVRQVETLRARRKKTSAAFVEHKYVYRRRIRNPPSPWGYWLGTSFGVDWDRVHKPFGQFTLDLAGSFHFVYVGAGFGFGRIVHAYAEAGITKGFFFPFSSTQALELRPSISYGLTYPTSHYARIQLGIFYSTVRDFGVYRRLMSRTTGIVGGTVSFQQVLYGPDAQWNQALMFGFVVGKSP